MPRVQIDTDVFYRHLRTLYEHWEKGRDSAAWGPAADALLVVHGAAANDADDPYALAARNSSTVALLYWLTGYEFTDISLLFTQHKVLIFTSAKKGLFPLSPPFPVHVKALPQCHGAPWMCF